MGLQIREEIKSKEIPNSVENENSLLVILGNSEISRVRTISLPGVIQDIANLKRLFLSDNIGFAESNILTLLNVEKQEVILHLNEKIQRKDWDNIILYYSGPGGVNKDKEFYVTFRDSDLSDMNSCMTAQEIGLIFEKVDSNIILIFDCCHAQRAFKYLYNKDVFLLGAVSEIGYAKDTLEGGLFTKNLVDVLKNGIDNNQDTLSLNDIYLEIRKKLIHIQEPKMLTTNIVQHQLLLKNQFQFSQQKIQESIRLKSKNQISGLIRKHRLKEAFEQLTIFMRNHNEDLKNKLTLFESRFARLTDEILLGLISKDTSNLENNQIVYGLLNLMKEI